MALPTNYAKFTPAPKRLLDKVRTRPQDDARRLAVAAAYDERGEPRGAFIRAQLAGDAAAAQDLLQANEHRWTAYVGAGSTFRFERGFLAQVRIVTGDTLERPKLVALVRAEPVVTDATISIAGTSEFGMEKLPALLAVLLHWPLARLIVRDGVFDRAEAYYENDSRGFMDHSWRSVPANEGQRLLAALERLPPRPPALVEVGLLNAGLSAADLPRVLALPLFAGARSLDLSSTPWGDGCVPVLAAAAGTLPARIVLRDANLGEAARRELGQRFGTRIEL